MKCLVLAAGMSTRLAALTGGAPKPLTPIGGVPVLHRNLRWLAGFGIREVFVNLHHRAEEVIASVGDGAAFGVHVTWSRETAILGTAGAAKKLERELTAGPDGRFLVVYGDNVFGFNLQALIARHAAAPALATIALFDPQKNPNTGIAGGRVQFDTVQRVTRFVEGDPAANGAVNAGVYVCESAILERVPPVPTPCDWAREVFPQVLASGGALGVHVIDGYCLGIDTPEAYHRAQELVKALDR